MSLAKWLTRSFVVLVSFAVPVIAQTSDGFTLVDAKDPAAAGQFVGSSEQVTTASDPKGVAVSVRPGADGYPGVSVVPSGAKTWDLSRFGHVAATITNTSDKALTLTLRVDDSSDWRTNPWNGSNLNLKPGATGTAKVIFGYSFGNKGHALRSAEVAKVLLFLGKGNDERSFRIESLVAGGAAGETPPVDEKAVRLKPKDGHLLGAGIAVDAKQLTARNAEALPLPSGAVKLTVARDAADPSLTYKPAMGRWDLREATQVRATLRNDGATAVRPRLRVESNPGPTDAATGTDIAPGATADLVATFLPAIPWEAVPESGDRTSHDGVKGTGTKFTSDAVSGVVVALDRAGVDQSIVIESIKVESPADRDLPSWLGTRPPVEGAWTRTFADEFDGSQVDLSKWNYYGENYWDKKSHFSKDNTIVDGGVARLRFERRPGHQNDDSAHKRHTDYATGFLDGYGKWVQRYGYFEARMKLPKAPGLWPAFWLMPDRGLDAGPQWKRQSTDVHGMEFDVMEQLTRWGPYRYNIAMHWDGYDKGHKSTGSTAIYFRPDADGYVTSGVLWLPGQLTYYANGREVAKWTASRISSVPANLMFTLPSGGWDNNAVDDATLPDDFVIDYVRCWQRDDLASAADGFRQPAPGNELGKDRK